MKVMQVRPSHANSYEHLFHDVKADKFLLPLRNPIQDITRNKLLEKRLQRAIGTTYDPEDELKKALFANRVGDSCGEPPEVDTGCYGTVVSNHPGAGNKEVRVELDYGGVAKHDAGAAQGGGGGIGVVGQATGIDGDSRGALRRYGEVPALQG